MPTFEHGHGPMASTKYHHVSARVLGIANKLRELGVESALQVPSLVIAGDQSSGKSSVVEAIAGVALPRSDGTCTRCPTEVRMRAQKDGITHKDGGSNQRSWSCRIKLCRDYDEDGKPLLEKPPEELFCTVRSKSHITACVTAAQAVLLNPRAVKVASGGAHDFIPDLSGSKPEGSDALRNLGESSNYELGFTANKVVLEIDGAEADLTIIDLPGIIHDHPKGRHYVEIVERMTKQNLSPEHHIIAMALPAAADAETQAIRLWAREVDPQGDRSIGIITKPDMIGEGAHITHGKLVRLVAGKGGSMAGSPGDSTHLKLGYYVVKNPSQEQLQDGISFEGARAAEETYFSSNTHWASAAASGPHIAQRLGANNLRAGLSSLLVERIEAQLPSMRRNAREQLAALERELSSMPPPPSSDALQELRSLLWTASTQLEQQIYATGQINDKRFFKRIMLLFKTYSERAIRSTPAFLVSRTLISALSNVDKGVHVDTAAPAPASPSPPSSSGGAAPVASSAAEAAAADKEKQRLLEEGELNVTDFITSGEVVAGEQEAAEALQENEKLKRTLQQALFPVRHMTLEQVRVMRERHSGRELPGFSPYSAVEELIKEFKGQWSAHARECLEEVAEATQAQAGGLVMRIFERFPKAQRAVGMALTDFIEDLTTETERGISSLMEMEEYDTFTLNDHYLKDQFTIFLGRLKRAYLRAPAMGPDEKKNFTKLLHSLAAYGVHFSSHDALFMAQPTAVDDELNMMAACLAYFKVAFKRVQDGVPMLIRNTLLRRLADRKAFEAAIMQQLGISGGGGAAGGLPHENAAEVARLLLAEDETVVSRRTQRRDMVRRLKEALAVLHSPDAQV